MIGFERTRVYFWPLEEVAVGFAPEARENT